MKTSWQEGPSLPASPDQLNSSDTILPRDTLPLRVKVIYGFGEWSSAASSAARTLYWLFFLANIAGVNVGLASGAIAIGRIWDAINDPLVGMISDKLNTRWGRRRPFLLFGAVPFGIAFFLMFLVPPFESQVLLAFYYAFIFILYDTLYTIINVPYVALAPALTEDYDERSSLAGWRSGFMLFANLVTAVAFKSLAEGVFAGWFGGDLVAGYAVSAGLWGLSMVAPPLLLFAKLDEPAQTSSGENIQFVRSMKEVFANRPFRMAAIIYLVTFTAADVVAAVLIWYLDFYINAGPRFESILLGLMLVIAIVTMPLVVRMMHHYGKRKTYIIFMGFWMVMLLFITQIPPGGRNLVLVIGGLSGLGYGAATSIPWAIVADVIETDELKTGKRREGAYSGFLVFLRKFAGAAAIFLVGQVLNRAGFIESSGGSVVQPQSALDALQFLVSIVPIGLLLIAIFAAWRFPLERAEHDEIRRQLVEKRRAAQEE